MRDMVISGVNVNKTYPQAVSMLRRSGVRQTSRAGDVLVMPHPIVTVTNRPEQRVLMCPRRDANPFFHVMEFFWMMTGSNDARWLDNFVRDFSSRYAEEGGIMHGAYGHRWRSHWMLDGGSQPLDQLAIAVARLRHDPLDRRVVIQMWDPNADLFWPADDPGISDHPCNTTIFPRIVDGRLDISVMCRSNDLVWGCFGANVVHFSFLQEWMAGQLGVDVGTMYQWSNNFHGYVKPLDDAGEPSTANPYDPSTFSSLSLVDDAESWDAELRRWFESPRTSYACRNVWFEYVLPHMWRANEARRDGDYDRALAHVDKIEATDWRMACRLWLVRRRK